MGSAVSVVDIAAFGASFSIRSFGRMGSSLSLLGLSRLGSSFSLLDFSSFGASLALRSYARLGSSLSVQEIALFGSSLSLRRFSRLGSTFSLLGVARCGKTVSLIGLAQLGSSVSLRSFARLGSAISVLDFTSFGSTLSIRKDTTISGDTYTYGKLHFNHNTYIGEDNSALETYVTGARVMSLTETGGTLHGMWMADTVVAVSDRRLKEKISPITRALETNYKAFGVESGRRQDGPKRPSQRPQALSWVLRQLRPVSYNFKKGSDAKNIRFGFIADEMQRVLPQVVRELPRHEQQQDEPAGKQGQQQEEKEPPTKGIVYPDLIAVLTAMMRDFSSQMKDVSQRVQTAEHELDRLDREDPMVSVSNFATGFSAGRIV